MKIYNINEIGIEDILKREEDMTPEESVSQKVSGIIEQVRLRGDDALREYSGKFDGWADGPLEVSDSEIDEAFASVDAGLIGILKSAAENIRRFHSQQVRTSFVLTGEHGTLMGQKFIPIEKVGLYVPGGTAAYPSTVLMDAIPAKLAGCPHIAIATPAKGGKVSPVILAAARIAGVNHIYKVGGAQAIAALAYGTESIPRVDKIVGPGNAYVAEAKRQVYGKVSIDMIAGPSDILIISDGQSDARHLAADLLSQAEHDTMAAAVLVTNDAGLAERVSAEVDRQLETLPRRQIAAESIKNNGKIIVTDSIAAAVEVANRIAPEHLELCVEDPFACLDLVKNAGSVFMGRNCPEALGDYLAGPNHTLPTSGTARFSNPLSVDDFVKKTQFTYFTAEALEAVSRDVAAFARAEGLEGHARSALIRGMKDGEDF